MRWKISNTTLSFFWNTHANVIKLKSGVSCFLRIIMCKIEMRHRVFYCTSRETPAVTSFVRFECTGSWNFDVVDWWLHTKENTNCGDSFLGCKKFQKTKSVCHQTLSLCVCVCVCVCSLSLSASIPSAIVLIPAHSVVDEDGKTGQKLLTTTRSSSADYYPSSRRSWFKACFFFSFLVFLVFLGFLQALDVTEHPAVVKRPSGTTPQTVVAFSWLVGGSIPP